MQAAAFEGMAANPAYPPEERVKLALQACELLRGAAAATRKNALIEAADALDAEADRLPELSDRETMWHASELVHFLAEEDER